MSELSHIDVLIGCRLILSLRSKIRQLSMTGKDRGTLFEGNCDVTCWVPVPLNFRPYKYDASWSVIACRTISQDHLNLFQELPCPEFLIVLLLHHLKPCQNLKPLS